MFSINYFGVDDDYDSLEDGCEYDINSWRDKKYYT